MLVKKTWYEKGVKVANDFFKDENGLLLSKELFKNKFNITYVCTMQYNTIMSPIARFLKIKILVFLERNTVVCMIQVYLCTMDHCFFTKNVQRLFTKI